MDDLHLPEYRKFPQSVGMELVLRLCSKDAVTHGRRLLVFILLLNKLANKIPTQLVRKHCVLTEKIDNFSDYLTS